MIGFDGPDLDGLDHLYALYCRGGVVLGWWVSETNEVGFDTRRRTDSKASRLTNL